MNTSPRPVSPAPQDGTSPLVIRQISVSAMDNNCYLLCVDNHGFLIDAADDTDALLALAHDAGVTIETVLTSHSHWDHTRALSELLARTKATHLTSALDNPDIPASADQLLHDGDTLDFYGHTLTFRILRGHTTGGVMVAVNIDQTDHLFVGDSLFPGGVGKTNSPEEFTQLLTDVTERIFAVYPDNAVVHPGHGASTTVGTERPHLKEWQERGW